MSIKIGFSNLDERNAFAREMREQLEQVASRYDDIQLILRDNQHDTELAVANAEEFARLGVDIAIIYHIDERAGMRLTTPLRLSRIPIIAVEFHLPWAAFMGIDNRTAGAMSGREGGKWIRDHWSGQIDKLVFFTDQRVVYAHRDRFTSALGALRAEIPLEGCDPFWVDSGTESQLTADRFSELLKDWEEYHHIAVITMGDVVSRGVLEAARAMQREEDIAVMSFDGTAWALEEFGKPFSRLIVSPHFNLESYCQEILDLAREILNGKTVNQATLVQPILQVRT